MVCFVRVHFLPFVTTQCVLLAPGAQVVEFFVILFVFHYLSVWWAFSDCRLL